MILRKRAIRSESTVRNRVEWLNYFVAGMWLINAAHTYGSMPRETFPKLVPWKLLGENERIPRRVFRTSER